MRLNEPEYDPNDFVTCGIAHAELEFEDCTVPSEQIVKAFLKFVKSTDGLVAVHCKVTNIICSDSIC